MSKEKLLCALESADNKNNFNNVRIKKIREDNKLKNRFLRPKIKEIRRTLDEIENKQKISKSKRKEIEQNIIELKKSILKLNKYHDYDDIEYKGIGDIGNLFDEFDEDYYFEPIKTKSSFNRNYIKYECRGDKNKNLSVKEYLYMIIPYLRDRINTHKTPKVLKVHSDNKVIDYETTLGEW